MKYRKLRIANYRGVVSSELEFESHGLTLVQGPNEVGKTSLGEAIRILFDYPHSSKNKAVVAIRPVHRDEGPEIELEAESGPYRFTYAKRFHKRPETRLTITAPKAENHTGREAHDRAFEILAETLDIDLWKALTIQQGEAIDQPNLGKQQSLSAALDKAAGGVPTEEAEEDLFERVAQEYERYYTPRGQEKKNLKDAREENHKAENEVNELKNKLRELHDDIDKAARLQKELADLKGREANLTTEVAEYGETLREIEALEGKVREAKLKMDSAKNSLRLEEKKREDREELIAHLEETQNEYDQVVEASKDWMPSFERAKMDLKEAETAYEKANQRRKAAEELAKIRRDDVDHLNNLLFLEQLGERKSRIDEARTNAAHAEDVLANNQVDDVALKKIESAERDLLAANSRLETAAPSVRLTGLNQCHLNIDRDATIIQNEEVREVSVPDRMRIVIPEKLEIEVAAGSSIDELTRKVSQAHEAIDFACRKAGVSDPDSARTAFESRRNALNKIAEKDKVEKEDLRDFSYDELASRLLRLQEVVPTYHSTRTKDPAIAPDLDAANLQRRNAEKALENCDSELETARHAATSAQAIRDELNSKNETARVNLGSLEKELERARARLASARKDDSDESLHSAWQRARDSATEEEAKVHDAKGALMAKNPDRVRALVETTTSSLSSCKDRREAAQRELSDLRARLRYHGEEGLHEKLSTAETKREMASSNYRALSRAAAAAKLLYEIMKRERDKARRAYVAPLRDKVERLGRFVFDQEFQVELDENLQIIARTHNKVTVPFPQLSGGTKEQLSLIFRLACSMIVAPEGGMPLIMDDALGYTDPDRLKLMGAVLAQGAKECQIVILTCIPERYSHIGEASIVSL